MYNKTNNCHIHFTFLTHVIFVSFRFGKWQKTFTMTKKSILQLLKLRINNSDLFYNNLNSNFVLECNILYNYYFLIHETRYATFKINEIYPQNDSNIYYRVACQSRNFHVKSSPPIFAVTSSFDIML